MPILNKQGDQHGPQLPMQLWTPRDEVLASPGLGLSEGKLMLLPGSAGYLEHSPCTPVPGLEWDAEGV